MLTRNGNQALEFIEIYETNAKKKKKWEYLEGYITVNKINR